MKVKRSWILAAAVSAVAGVVIGVVPALGSAGASGSVPAWEPDPNANGTMAFFDASGNAITGGNDLSHLFSYAEASSAEDPSGFHKATVFFAFPDHTKTNTADWFVSQASASTTYPNASAPAPVNTFANPVATTTGSGDVNLTAALGGAVLDTTAGYANIVQLRLMQSNGTNYWDADIAYDTTAGTWTQVYPAVATATATTTTLGASPAGHQASGGTVDLTATVSPSGAAGTVQFKDGATNLGSPVAVSSGTATFSTTALATGSHSLTAVFTPTDSTAFAASTSAATTYLIGTVPDAPSGVSAVAGNASATVSWTAPANDGGLPVGGYDVQYSSNGGTTWTPASAAFHTSTATTQTVSGLTNGTGYQFHVAAINAIGTGAYAVTPATVTPVADASKLAQAKSVTIKYGSTTTVSAKLTDTKTAAVIPGVAAQLTSRTSTAKPFVLVKTVTTNSSGIAAVTVKPGVNTQYQWVFPGTATHAAATSDVESVSVAQVVSIRATATRLRHGSTFKLWGGVTPNETGQYVYLQKRTATGWKTIAKARLVRQLLPNGRTSIGYVFAIRPSIAGRYIFRVSRPVTSANAAGTSASVTITVT